MENYNFILKRRSIRKYKDKKIPQSDIKLILEAARHAPVPYDHATWRLVLISDKELIKKITSISGGQNWVNESALIIVGVITPLKGTLKWKTVDITIALQNMVLMAEALGYGSCWVGYFKENKLKEILNIPEDHNVLAYITLGFKDEEPKKRNYENIENLIFNNKFNT